MNQFEKVLNGNYFSVPAEDETFRKIVEQFHHPLYRYYAVHTYGDLVRALDMTVRTFSILHCKREQFPKQGFTSWLFGIAWDVLNADYSRKDAERRRLTSQMITTFKVHKLGPNHVEMRRILKLLRGLTFYPRETLYLRFFAGLNTKDIGALMDKNETSVKTLVYQGVVEFSSEMDEVKPVSVTREMFVALSQTYHVYLEDSLKDIIPHQSVAVEVIRTTNRLKALREVVSMKPEMSGQLIEQIEQSIHARDVTRL